ncbi:MAG: hypothetical protein JNN07_15430 [Verrucomicrobiales bacterium]|nr:hypothetical protein [Verrucomicrobiales bacterium]
MKSKSLHTEIKRKSSGLPMLTTRLAWGMLVGGLVMLMVKSEAPVEVRASELREVRSDAPVTSLSTATSDRLKDGPRLVDVLPAVDLSRRVDLSYPIELPLSK